MDVDVLAVYPHAHYLGKLLEAYATLPDGKRQWLIRIPDWDLNRQAVYRYRQPLSLPKGTLISMRYHYDNSAANPRNPNHPPRRVKAGNNATDEMGHLWLQVLPQGPGERPPPRTGRSRHAAPRGKISGRLRLISRSRRAQALPPRYAGRVSRLSKRRSSVDPKQSQGHNMLGAAFTRMGRAREAMDQFEQALRLDPANVNARYNLVFALVKAGNLGGRGNASADR